MPERDGRVVLGTRGSPLALWQARHVAAMLRRRHPGLVVDERIIRTEGDVRGDIPLHEGGVGFFVRRIEECLSAGEIDLAVHSLKDLPTSQPTGLVIAAVPERHDPRDAVLSLEGWTLDALPRGARIGTGSPRRRAQLLNLRSDLDVQPVRGNVDTRVRKLEEREFDAIMLALAGVERLGIDRVPARPIDIAQCLPAVGQGALAVETRADDATTRPLVASLDDPSARIAVEAERVFLARLGGGCLAPATAHARLLGERVTMEAVVGSLDGKRLLRDRAEGRPAEIEAAAVRLAERLLEAGADALLRAARDGAGDAGD